MGGAALVQSRFLPCALALAQRALAAAAILALPAGLTLRRFLGAALPFAALTLAQRALWAAAIAALEARDIFLRPRRFPGMADSPPVIDSILP
jgi:hypothetical protein